MVSVILLIKFGLISGFVGPSLACTDVIISLWDSYGDGWNDNILYLSSSTSGVTLPADSSGTASLCLDDGIYSPYCCGGSYDNEVSWDINGYGVSGSADDSCDTIWGSFEVLSGVVYPTHTPTSYATSAPTMAPTTCQLMRFSLYDTNGDGWSGSYLIIDANHQLTADNFADQTHFTICLNPGEYTPTCCGGDFYWENSWEVSQIGEDWTMMGFCDADCSENWGSFQLSVSTKTNSNSGSSRGGRASSTAIALGVTIPLIIIIVAGSLWSCCSRNGKRPGKRTISGNRSAQIAPEVSLRNNNNHIDDEMARQQQEWWASYRQSQEEWWGNYKADYDNWWKNKYGDGDAL